MKVTGYAKVSKVRCPVKKNLRLSGQRIGIKALAEKVSERYNVSIGELRKAAH